MINFLQINFLLNLPRIGAKTVLKDYKSALDNNADLDSLKDIIAANKPELHIYFDDAERIASTAYENAKKRCDSDPQFNLLTIYDKDYPSRLRDLQSKALFIYTKGNTEILEDPSIAFIGTRTPTPHAVKVEKAMVQRTIEHSNRVIVSGLAMGCDTAAHEVAVENNHPTVACLPSGFDNIAPSQNKGLAQKIVETGGCLVSAYTPDTKPQKYFYTERDKIIAELADGLIVGQSEATGGTMVTVKAGIGYNKPIGCNTAYGEDIPYAGNQGLVVSNQAHAIYDSSSLLEFLNNINADSIYKKTTNTQLSLDI